MASADREPIIGDQGQSPWSGAPRGAKPSEAESFLAFAQPKESNFPIFADFCEMTI